jgi:hypothetical protein
MTLRLPKAIVKTEKEQKLLEFLSARKQKLRPSATAEVFDLEPDQQFLNAIHLEHKKGKLSRGYELIERILASEAKGQAIVDKKTNSTRKPRISRLLVLSNDGSDRYLRKIEKLLQQNMTRVLAIRLPLDSKELGEMYFGPGKAVKIIMIEHKDSVAAVLLSLIK